MGVIDDLDGVVSPLVASLADRMLNQNKSLIEDFRSHTGSSPWTNLPRNDVADRLEELISDPDLLDQASLGLCGLAAFFECFLHRAPDLFCQLATELYDTGSASLGDFHLSPSPDLLSQDYANEAAPAMNLAWGTPDHPEDPDGICPPADWMLLSALQDTINRPFLGMPQLFDNWSIIGTSIEDLVNVFGNLPFYGVVGWEAQVQESDSGVIPTPDWGDLTSLRQLAPSSLTDVVLTVNSNIIKRWQTGLAGTKPGEVCDLGWNHVVVLRSPIEQSPGNPDNLHLDVWSWAELYPIDAPSAVLAEYYEAVIVAQDNRPNGAAP
jgi:hypothetical protein